MKAIALLVAALAFVAPLEVAPVQVAAGYLASRQQADGGFAEPGSASDPTVTGWAVLALAAAGRDPSSLRNTGLSAADYLAGKPTRTTSELALRVLALRALGEEASELAERLVEHRRPDGRIGPLVNSTAWSVIALRAAGRPAPRASVRYLLRHQHRSGGWSWAGRGPPDSNDTAAVIQALRAAGRGGAPIARGLVYLRRLQNDDGGFALVAGARSDAQSTAWAIQAFIAAGARPPAAAFRYLGSLRRQSGSFRYSRSRAITPVWVTANVVPALARKPFPLR